MDDYLTRVAEAVRDAMVASTRQFGTVPGIENTIDIHAVIASVPRPEPVAWIIDWPEAPELGHYLAEEPSPAGRSRGLYAEPVAAQSAVPVIPAEKFPPLDQSWSANTEYIAGWNACRDAMLATAPEAPQVADDAATLRSAIRAMAAMLQAREWAEHVSNDPDVTDLEVQITELVGTATKLREQNATLGEAISLQHANGEALAERVMQAEAQNAALVAAMQNIADEFVPGDEQKLYGTPTDALDRIRSTARATLASAKGGAA
ncbi:hypothetical protein [Microvirgula aerodenitrificans]|uniref:hypothetical protein n=1 Tax=Microvirgula aerodenitrificans TaxID=57480 RepID=UPI0028ED155C|nr:hypothetical protein [Microvirgula aerodenitrificans]